MRNDRFKMVKVTLDGTQTFRDAVLNQTRESCVDRFKFPFGRQKDEKGDFVWTIQLMEPN